MNLTPQQLAILRQKPHSTKLFLSIYQPKVVFSAQVTGSYSQGANQVSYYSVATGSYQNIYPNMTARIGSTQGGNEFGDLRVRSASGTYINFAENELAWQQGMYLTLIDFINIEAIFPRIIPDPNNQTNVLFFKDYDIPYTNQNTVYGTFPCAGPHRAGFIVTGSYSTYYSSTGTYNVKGDSLTYSWAFEGGTPTGSTAKDPGVVQYATPGHYKTRFITTSSSGVRDTTYRYVSAYQKPSQGTFNPIEAWELEDLQGSRSEGGYTARIKIMSIIPEIQPNALVVIFAEDTYGGTQVSLGGNSQNNESIVFTGYVLRDSISFDYKKSTVTFEIGSPSEVMKEVEGFSISCESKAAATTWYELTEMTIQKALYHYLRWQSTVLDVNDFQYTGDDRYLQFFDTDRESLFDAIDNFMRNGLLGSVICDRQGKLWAEISHFGLEAPFSIPTSSMSLRKQDWMGEPTIQERRKTDTSFVELGGVAYYGTASNTFSALLSNAPGITPLYHGKSEKSEGMILVSQTQLNKVAANYLAYKNTQFPEITMPLNGNYRNLDIAPQEKFNLILGQGDTIRNKSLQDKFYLPTSMSWQYNPTKQVFIPDITLEQMATGSVSESVFIPPTPPFADSGFDYPSLQLPSFPVFNPSSEVGPTVPIKVVMVDPTVGLLYSSDFDSVNPNWITVNNGLTAAQYQGINFMFIVPSGAIYVGHGRKTTSDFIARAPAIGSPFVVLNSGNKIWGAGYNPDVPDYVVLMMEASGTQYYWSITGETLTQGSLTSYSEPGSTITDITYGFNAWTITGFGKWWRLAANGLSETANGTITNGPAVESKRASGSKYLVNARNAVTGLCITVDNFVTNTLITDSNMSSTVFVRNLALDPTGMFMMAPYAVGAKGKSSDGGTTWGLLPNLPPGGEYAFAYAGGDGTGSRWIAARGVVRFSPDFGNTWINKEGNITSTVPFPLISIVRAVGFPSG